MSAVIASLSFAPSFDRVGRGKEEEYEFRERLWRGNLWPQGCFDSSSRDRHLLGLISTTSN
jgi:hypothetical protein